MLSLIMHNYVIQFLNDVSDVALSPPGLLQLSLLRLLTKIIYTAKLYYTKVTINSQAGV